MDDFIRQTHTSLGSTRVIPTAIGSLIAILIWAALIPRPVAAQRAGSSRALTEKEVVELLQEGVTSRRVVQLVEEYGINFELTDEIEARLHRAGAGETLIKHIRDRSASRGAVTYQSTGKRTTNWWNGAGGTACCRCGIKHYGSLPASFQPRLVTAVTFFLTGSRSDSYYTRVRQGPTRLKFVLGDRGVLSESRPARPGETAPLDLPWVIRFEFRDPVQARPGTRWQLLDGDGNIYSAALLHLSDVPSEHNSRFALEGTSDQNGCQYTFKKTVWYSARFESARGARPRPEPNILRIEGPETSTGFGEFIVKLGGREIHRTHAARLSVYKSFGKMAGREVVLLQEMSGGNICNAITYRFVSWRPNGSYWLSDRFGNCSGPKVDQKGSRLTVHFDSWKGRISGQQYPPETWTYAPGPGRDALSRVE